MGGSTRPFRQRKQKGPDLLVRALRCLKAAHLAALYIGAGTMEDLAERVNQMDGWVKAMGIRIVKATPDEVTCEWDVATKHHQGYGIVHGGVHCGVIETLASIGAAMVAHPRGQRVAGLENSTSFIRAVRSGRLHAVARPVTRGRKSQVWEGWIRDEQDRLVAQGRVRLLCFDEDRELG